MSATTLSETSVDINSRDKRADKYLSFILDDEEYAMEILTVSEIISVIDITSIPNTPKYVKGVINLRGKVIPIVDLRTRFSIPFRKYDEKTCIIVVNLKKSVMGIAVDMVSEVLDIHKDDVDYSSDIGSSMNADFVKGIGKVDGKMVILLDVEKVLNSENQEVNESVS